LRAGVAAVALADPDGAKTGRIAPVVAFSAAKNPAAVALGRLGGLKGGKARAASLSAAQRAEIARKGGQTAAANRAKRVKKA